MENPRPEKVAVVDEVKQRLSGADATLLTDYRGIDVAGMSELRRALRAVGGDVKIYKNTLVRFAAEDLGLELADLLVGPTALTFVSKGEDGNGDPVLVAKAVRDFAKGNPNLEVKGGLLGERLLTADEVDQLAQVAPRDELLARFAGGLAAPMQKMANLLEALPRNLAYGLAALIEERGGPEAAEDPTVDSDDDADATTEEQPDAEAPDPGAEAGTANPDADGAADDSVTEASATEDPATEDPATEASATEASATEDPATEDPANNDPATDDSDSEED